MRNRALHDALKEFALEAAALLCDDQRGGAELAFDVTDERPPGRAGASRRGGRGPALYRYRPLTGRFIGERWPRLRELPSRAAAAEALGGGAAAYLRTSGAAAGVSGEQAEPALQAMLERLYEDATSFSFPEERFERVYREVERTLYRDTLPATVLAPLPGVILEPGRVELGEGLFLARGETVDAPPEAVWPEEGGGDPAALCVLERDVAPDDPVPAAEFRERFGALVTALRLLKRGRVALGGIAWRRAAGGRWAPLALGGSGPGRGGPCELGADEEDALRELLAAIEGKAPGGVVAFALARFEMGCCRRLDAEALSDYLLGLRALLDAAADAGRASLPLRLAALCAEEGERRAAQRRVEAALSLERYVMGGGRGAEDLEDWIGAESPRALVTEIEGHLRALLRDVICGYLEPDLKGVADDILLESPEPFSIEARELRGKRGPADVDTSEIEADRDPKQRELEGVTPSADWGLEDPESYSAPV